jgi:hypothetical protein
LATDIVLFVTRPAMQQWFPASKMLAPSFAVRQTDAVLRL